MRWLALAACSIALGCSSGSGAATAGDSPCIELCKLGVELDCAGGPNSVEQCGSICAALATKGAECKQASDEAYLCALEEGNVSLGCGSQGLHVRCGYCDELVGPLEQACGFSTSCVP